MPKYIDIKYKIYTGEYIDQFFVGDFTSTDEVADVVKQLMAESATSIKIDIRRVPTDEVRKTISNKQNAERKDK